MPSTISQSILNKVLDSTFFKRAMNKAPKIARNTHSLIQLIRTALVKSQEIGVGGIYDTLRQHVVLIGKMIKAYASGEYRNLSPTNLLKIIAGMLYFVSPIDFIPDFIPLLGLTDDIALLAWILSGINDEVEKFKEWENIQTHKL